MAGAHYTSDQIDSLAMQDVIALLALWREHPPTHEILAAVHRIVPVPATNADDPSNIGRLIIEHPDGCVTNGSRHE